MFKKKGKSCNILPTTKCEYIMWNQICLHKIFDFKYDYKTTGTLLIFFCYNPNAEHSSSSHSLLSPRVKNWCAKLANYWRTRVRTFFFLGIKQKPYTIECRSSKARVGADVLGDQVTGSIVLIVFFFWHIYIMSIIFVHLVTK